MHGLRGPRGDEPPNREMFKDAAGIAIRPTWVNAPEGQAGWKGHWTISRTHLTVVAEAIAVRDGEVRIEMHYSTSEQCDARCQNADGDDCTCSCEGANHGTGDHAAWTPVGETTLVRSTGTRVVERVLTREDVASTQWRGSIG